MSSTDLHPISYRFLIIADFQQGVPLLNTLVEDATSKRKTTKFGDKKAETSFYRVVRNVFRYLEPFRYRLQV